MVEKQIIETLGPIARSFLYGPVSDNLNDPPKGETTMVENKLAIKDLQKGMMVKVSDYLLIKYKVMIIEYVFIRLNHVVGISYAIGIDETNKPYLLTDDNNIILTE